MDLATLLQQAVTARARRVVLTPGRPAVFRDDQGATPVGTLLDIDDIKGLLKSALPAEMLREMRWGNQIPYQLEVESVKWDLMVTLTEDKELRVEMECRQRFPRRRRGTQARMDTPGDRQPPARGATPQARVFGRLSVGGGRASAAAALANPNPAITAASLQPPDSAFSVDLIERNNVANEPDYEMPRSLTGRVDAPAAVGEDASAEPNAPLELTPAGPQGAALVYAPDETTAARAGAVLEAAGYGAKAAASAADIVAALRYTTYPVVVLSPAGRLLDDPIHAGLRGLPMARRRTMFVVLLTADGEADDSMAAFAQSVDLCVPGARVAEAAERIVAMRERWVADRREFHEALEANGRM